jgi:CHAT domain-containing protein/Flp pilus assembly protein TadD
MGTAARAFPGSYRLQSGQLTATTEQDATRAVAKKLYDEGLVLFKQGTGESLKQAIVKWQEALKLWHQVDNKFQQALTLASIGRVYSDLGEKQKALYFSNQALLLFRAVGSKEGKMGEATTLNNIGLLYSNLGKKEEALKNFNQALPLFQALDEKYGEATTLSNIGLVYSALGQTQKAIEFYEQALRLKRAVRDNSGEAITLNNIGQLYSDLGKKDEALENFNQALPLAVGDKRSRAIILNNIGQLYSDLGNKHKALENFQQALLLRVKVGDEGGQAITLNNIGQLYSDLGEKQQALPYFNQALPLFRTVSDRRGEASTLNNIGKVYFDLGKKQQVLPYCNQALALFRTVSDRRGEARALYNIGLVYQDTKQPTEAIKKLEQSASIYLQLRSGVEQKNRKTFLESEQSTVIALINLLINQNQQERAFEWANLVTTADLADYSRLVKVKVANPQAQLAVEQWNQSNIQLESLRKELQQKFTPELSQQVNKLQEKLNQQAEDMRSRFTEVADLFETKPTDIAQLKAIIPEGTTVIQPVPLSNSGNAPDTIALFVLTRDKPKVIKVPVDPAKFDTLLTQTYNQLTHRNDDTFLDNLEKLYELLIRPVETEIQATNPKKLSIIATGKLRYIPFEALYDSKTDQYLIQKYPVSYLTRLSTRSLQAKGTQTAASAKKVLAFGNPVPNKPLALDGAEAEVKSITQIFPGSEAFVNSKATLNTFKIQSPRFSLLHLATHGCFQKGGCPKLGLEENTLLFADQRFNIRDAALLGLQNVDLIALSACQTALQTNSNGEEIAGLAYLFERAGAKAVIASLWSADDKTTEAIMVQFYQNLKKGMSKDEALRQAKLSQIKSHPFFWSPFVLIGDGR